MTFKDLEPWQKEFVLQNLNKDETIYIEYTTKELLKGFKREDQELKKQQKEFIKYLENELNTFRNSIKEFECSEKFQGDYSIIYYICQYKLWEAKDILSKYKEIIGEHE